MAKLINIGFGNVVNSRKIVAVVSPDAAPGKTNGAEYKGNTVNLLMQHRGEKQKQLS